MLGVICAGRPTAARAAVDDLALKTAVIGRVAEFVEWPAEAGLSDPDHPFEITVLGQTPLEPRLAAYYGHVRISGHPVKVRHAKDIADIGRPHLLFLGPSVEESLEAILTSVGRAPVLVMGDSEGFGYRGVAINLYVMDGHVRFEIARASLKRNRLQASFRLLMLAKRIDGQHALR